MKAAPKPRRKASEPDPRQAQPEVQIGARMRHARLAKGYTLKQLADAVSCSESLISKVENDKIRPSIFMLHRLTQALETNIAELFSAPDPGLLPVRIVRADQRPTFHVDPDWNAGDGVWLERLIAPAKGGLLQANILNLAPGARSDGVIQHKGEELGFVVEGLLELIVDEVVYVLRAGDSFFFPSSMAHGYRNSGDALVRVLWVNTPPSF
jgi:transcriptional regulator with XRE-family HTH domain